jgi:hypothetical protein
MDPETYALLKSLTPSSHIPTEAAPSPAMSPTGNQRLDELVNSLFDPTESRLAAAVQNVLQMRLPILVAGVCMKRRQTIGVEHSVVG